MYNGRITKKRSLIGLCIVLTLMMSILGPASLSVAFAADGDNNVGNESKAVRTIMIYLEGQYINVRVATDVYNRIDEICAEAGHTKSYVVEKALSDFIEDYEAKQEALQSIKDGSAKLVKTGD